MPIHSAAAVSRRRALPVVIAADLGGTKLSTAVIDSQLCQHDAVHQEIAGQPYNEVIRIVLDSVNVLAMEHPEVVGIGIAVAGQVDERTGIVSHREIRRGEEERGIAALPVQRYPLASVLQHRTGLPVIVENDGNAAVLAEWRAGVAQGTENVVALTVGTYLGSGVISRGAIIRRRTSGPLLGGVLMSDPTNPTQLQYLGVLVGGNTVEALATKMRGLASRALAAGRTYLTAELIADQARQGDPDALQIFQTVASSLRIAVVNAINEWDPEVLVLAGGLMAAHDLLLAELPAFVEQFRLPGADVPGPPIKLAKFCADAPKIGAAILALENAGIPFTTNSAVVGG